MSKRDLYSVSVGFIMRCMLVAMIASGIALVGVSIVLFIQLFSYFLSIVLASVLSVIFTVLLVCTLIRLVKKFKTQR